MTPDEIRLTLEYTSTMSELTPEEQAVIINKATETPFSGDLLYEDRVGIYICKQCGVKLYESATKFEASCGWLSFDESINGAVKRSLDDDGHRIEITCMNCGGHLGHVFEGEGFTSKNTRHCVNSLSLKFSPK